MSSTTQRGYGTAHQKARRAAAAKHRPTDPCPRCGQPLGPLSSSLHYDHNATRTGYLGFSHERCNTAAGGRERGRRQRQASRRNWYA